MEVAKRYVHLTKEKILSVVSPKDIYLFYLGPNAILGKPIRSPFRSDKNPSFSINPKTWMFKDFATGESGDCFEFVKRIYGEPSFKSTLDLIQHDLCILDNSLDNRVTGKQKKSYKPAITEETLKGHRVNNAEIKVKFRKLEDYDIKYWKEFGISPKLLGKARIAPISHYFINGKPFVAEKYSYVFIEKKDKIVTYKIYQPYSKYKKWISNNDSSIWELWHMLPEKGKLCIITSSRKDALVFHSCIDFYKSIRGERSNSRNNGPFYIMNEGTSAVALQSENVMPKESVIEELKSRFEKVILFYDNDLAGKRFARKIAHKYNLEYFYPISGYACKDISDIYKYQGHIFAKQVYSDLILNQISSK